MDEPERQNAPVGVPRWLIYGFLAKMGFVAAVTAAVVWWAYG